MAHKHMVVGLDLGGTKIQAVVLDRDARVVAKGRTRTPTSGGADAVVAKLAELTRGVVRDAGESLEALSAVGVGTPGRVDAEGTVRGAANLPGFTEPIPLAGLLSAAVGLPALVVNDVNAGATGEQHEGAGRGFQDVLTVFVGTGIGAAVVLEGKLRSGINGAAGELGHMVAYPGGDLCGCGRRGCVEAYAGRGSLERKARAAVDAGRPSRLFAIQEEMGRPRMTSAVVATALQQGDPLAHELLEQAIVALAVGIASAVNVLDVEAVVVGGGLADKLGAPFVERIAVAMVPHLFVAPSPLKVLPASLGDLSGAVGAGLLARTSTKG